MAESELRSIRSSPDQGDFRRSLSFCRASRVARFLEDETRHSTRRSWFWWFETRHRPVEGVSPNMTGRFRSGWSVPTGLRFAWTPLFRMIHLILKKRKEKKRKKNNTLRLRALLLRKNFIPSLILIKYWMDELWWGSYYSLEPKTMALAAKMPKVFFFFFFFFILVELQTYLCYFQIRSWSQSNSSFYLPFSGMQYIFQGKNWPLPLSIKQSSILPNFPN